MEDTAPVTSIFVKGLTENATKEQLHDAFAQFGEIRNGLSGISLKPARDNRDPIAFVTFLSAESVPGAVAGPVYLDNQQVIHTTHLASSQIHCPSPSPPTCCSFLTVVKCSCHCANEAMHLWASNALLLNMHPAQSLVGWCYCWICCSLWAADHEQNPV